MTSAAKLALARALSSRRAGLVAGGFTRHRVRNNGISFDTAGWDPRAEASLAFRLYENAEIRFVRSFLSGTEQAIELGGSLGITGSHLLRAMASDGELTSVEANGELISVLRNTLAAHAGGRSVTVVHAGVTNAPVATLAITDSNLTSRLAFEGVAVPAMSLQAIASRAGYEHYSLVSDIEGGEASYIFSRDGLDGCERMVIELHNARHNSETVTSDDMVAELQRKGFRLLDRRGDVCAFARWANMPRFV